MEREKNMMDFIHRNLKVDPHPAAQALAAAVHTCNGFLMPEAIAISASIYPTAPRRVDPGPWHTRQRWGHRQNVAIYPASVMKFFLLAGFADLRQSGQIDMRAEDDRAAAAMIRESSNEATVYLMGRVTKAEDGSDLGPVELDQWLLKRALVQDWFAARGEEYAGIKLLHATYHDSPYGRARQARTADNANRLTAEAGARLMHDIARGALAGAPWMMDLLDRDFQRQPDYANVEGDQVRGFLAEGLPPDVRIWSKAGHTSQVRHDLLYGENASGEAFILSVMTEGEWTSRNGQFLTEFARAFHHAAFKSQRNNTTKILTGGPL